MTVVLVRTIVHVTCGVMLKNKERKTNFCLRDDCFGLAVQRPELSTMLNRTPVNETEATADRLFRLKRSLCF
jgi:hypothetical protein